MIKGARVTDDQTEVPAVVLLHDKRMKDAWCLATSRADLGVPGERCGLDRTLKVNPVKRRTLSLYRQG